jgi:hypothetical protein
MSSLSKLVACRGLVILLAMTLGVFGVQALQAKGKGCQTSCPVQTCQTSCVDKHAQHEAEEAREREEKAAEHARHEAEEECARQQKAYEHAQHEAAEAQERAAAKTCNMCAPKCEPVCAPKCEPKEISAVIVVEPAPQPTPEPFPQGLPKTASPTSRIGLVGVLSLTGFGVRFRR